MNKQQPQFSSRPDTFLPANGELNAGASLTILFPATEHDATTTQPACPTGESTLTAQTTQKRPTYPILVIDDETAVLTTIRRLLEHAGFSVLAAASGAAGVATARAYTGPLACALIDINMPDIGGIATGQAIRATHPDVPIVLMSGYPGDLLDDQPLPADPLTFLQKPFSAADLFATVRQIIA